MSMKDLKAQVAHCLTELGWASESGPGLAVARKGFSTIVGVKDAIAYLVDSRDNNGLSFLNGSYYSEGRNTLSSILVEIHKTANREVIGKRVAEFAAQVAEAIAETYAAKLLRGHYAGKQRDYFHPGTETPPKDGVYQLKNRKFARFENGFWYFAFENIEHAAATTEKAGFMSPICRIYDELMWRRL